MTRTIPMQLHWTEWYPVPYLESAQDLRNYGWYDEEEIQARKFPYDIPVELAGKFYQMVALRRELTEALKAIEDAHKEVPKPPTREDRNNKRRLAKRGGAR